MSQVKIEVEADTKKAKANIAQLTNEVVKLEKQADKASKKKLNLGGSVNTRTNNNNNIPSLHNGGVQPTGGNGSNPSGGSSSLGGLIGNFSGVAASVGAVAAGIAGVAKAVETLYNKMEDFVAVGAESAKNFESINTSLSTLNKNVGGSGNTGSLTEFIQKLAANGVSDIKELSEAAQKLMVSFKGDQQAITDWLSIIDDVGAGTGMGAGAIGEIVAQLANGGKPDIRDLSRLKNRGIPIFESLGEVLNVSADEAEAMAKAGKATSEQMLEAIRVLQRTKYNNFSANQSAGTLEGSQNTRTAMEGLARQRGTLEYDRIMAERNNLLASLKELDADNLLRQQEDIGIAQTKAGLDTLVDQAKEGFTELWRDILSVGNDDSKIGKDLRDKVLDMYDKSSSYTHGEDVDFDERIKQFSEYDTKFLSEKLLDEERKAEMLLSTIIQEGEKLSEKNPRLLKLMDDALRNSQNAAKILDAAYDKAKEREEEERKEAEKQRQKQESHKEYISKNGTNQEMAQNAGFDGYKQMTDRQKELEDLLKGEGLDDDQLEELQKIKSVLEAIDKRDAEEKRKEQELRKLSADIVDDRTKYSWEISDKMDDVREYAEKTGGNVGQLQDKLLDKLEKDIVDNYKKSGGRGEQLYEHGQIYDYYSQNQYTQSGMSTEWTDYVQYLKQVGGFTKHIDSAYQLAQGKDITDIDKMTQVQKQMDLMSCQVKKTNEQLQVLKDIRDKKITGLVPQAQ